jgi:hypothetical protein
MDENPYDSPTAISSASRSPRESWIALIPFLIAVPGVIVAAFFWHWRPLPRWENAIAFGVVGAILVFDLPVCAYVLFYWLRDGHPPDMSLAPLIPSREQRAFHQVLRQRPKLDDHQFYDVFYANSAIPKQLPVRLRKSLETVFGRSFAALHPTDNLLHADEEVDWADVFDQIHRDFGVDISSQITEESHCTFDSLLRTITKVLDKTSSLPVSS